MATMKRIKMTTINVKSTRCKTMGSALKTANAVARDTAPNTASAWETMSVTIKSPIIVTLMSRKTRWDLPSATAVTNAKETDTAPSSAGAWATIIAMKKRTNPSLSPLQMISA